MKKFTVVGLYEGNNQRYCTHELAYDITDAVQKARERVRQDSSEYLNIAAVFEGHLMAKDTGTMGEDDE